MKKCKFSLLCFFLSVNIQIPFLYLYTNMALVCHFDILQITALENGIPSLCDFSRMSLELGRPSKTIWTVSTQVRLCISVNDDSASHSKDSDMVFCCCVHNVYVSASCWTGWNICYTVNTCMVCLQCGLSYEWSNVQTDGTPCYTRDICMVSLHCEFCCV